MRQPALERRQIAQIGSGAASPRLETTIIGLGATAELIQL